MLEINQFGIRPGPYKHYKKDKDGNDVIYIVKNIITHRKNRLGSWDKLQDPDIIYEPLDKQYESVNGTMQMVHVCYSNPYSIFTEEVEKGLKRFTPV